MPEKDITYSGAGKKIIKLRRLCCVNQWWQLCGLDGFVAATCQDMVGNNIRKTLGAFKITAKFVVDAAQKSPISSRATSLNAG